MKGKGLLLKREGLGEGLFNKLMSDDYTIGENNIGAPKMQTNFLNN